MYVPVLLNVNIIYHKVSKHKLSYICMHVKWGIRGIMYNLSISWKKKWGSCLFLCQK